MPYPAKLHSYDELSIDNLKKYVLPHYGLEDAIVTQIKFKDSDKQRAVFKVEYMNKLFCLKKVYFGEQDLLFVYSSIEWLYRHGINVPRLLNTKNNSKFVLYNNMLFILTPWVEGIKCSYDNVEHILKSSYNLALIHRYTRSFQPIEGSKKRFGCEDLSASLQKHFNQMLNSSNLAFKFKDNFSKTFLNNFDLNLILAQIALKTSTTIDREKLNVSLCHMDYVNKNIIFDENNKLWLIDFDKCKIDYYVHDISYFLRRFLKRENTKWDLQLTINSLDVYEKIRPLTVDEYKYILCYLAFPHKFWKISRDYYNNINKCNKTSFQILLNKSVEKKEYHMEFIEALIKYIEKKFNIQI